MTTGRSRDAARLFGEAARLRSNLTAAGKALPPPNFSASKPSDWTEAHSYANCVERLRDALDTSFVVSDLPATETAGGGDRDEQFAIVAKLFHQASRLLSDLTASGKRLPEREVEKLRARIAGARGLVMNDLQIRGDWQILDALTPPESKCPLTGEAWLDSLDKPPKRDPSEDDK